MARPAVTDTERTKGPQEIATEKMLAAADWLGGDEYLGAKAALLGMARKLDGWDAVVQAAVEWAEEASGRRPRVPLHDSTTYGSYTRLLTELGLTAVSRAKLEAAGENLARNGVNNGKKDGGSGDGDDQPAAPEGGGKLAKITALRP